VAVEVTRERRRLGPLGKVMLGIGVVLAVGLVAGSAVVVVLQRKRERKDRALTAEALHRVSDYISGLAEQHKAGDDWRRPLFFGRHTDDLGTATSDHAWAVTPEDFEKQPDARTEVVLDAWGRPIRTQIPGPVHRHGWDIWSCGPNGIDEQGGGDDILVGEDVADAGSGR
jgi:hypothetical protein